MRTLLLGTASASWREWLREYQNNADIVLLAPQDAAFGYPARYGAIRPGKGVEERFLGSLDPLKAPHLTVAAAAILPRGDTILLLGDLGKTALARQTAEAVVETYRPDQILAPMGGHPWFPIAREVELAAAPPLAVAHAQRRAHWIDLLDRSHRHEFTFLDLAFQGTRLGTGTPITVEGALYAEKIGNTLYAVVEDEFEERELAIALDRTGTTKAHLISPAIFQGLLCALVRANGEEAGVGIIERFDLRAGTVVVRSTAVPPLPIATLRIGSLRLDREGNEIGELRPWAI